MSGALDEAAIDDLLGRLRDSPADYVKVAVTDVDGILRGKYLDKQKFLSAARSGFGFCNVVFGWDSSDQCYDNVAYTGWQSGYPDAEVRIDLSTHRTIPWESERDFFLGDFVGTGHQALDVCPRQALRRVVARATEMGYAANFGLEFEWFNFLETPQSLHDKDFRDLQPLTPGMFGYSVLRQTHNQPFFDALLGELRSFGVPLEGLHTETGPGVFEAAILYGPALEAADRAQLFKSGVKEIGHRFGILPTFMARWNTELPGCSGHAHQSLWDLDGERSLFFDEHAEHSMSSTFRSYLAGILTLLPELLVFWAPTVNSYKRLVDGFWAPTKATWGIDNRTVACRVIPGTASSTTARDAGARRRRQPLPGGGGLPGGGALGHRAGPRPRPRPDRRQRVCRPDPRTTAPHAPGGHRPAGRVEGGARHLRRRLRRPLRVDPRVGVAPVRRRGHRLGAAPLLRDHLDRGR